MLTQIVGKFEYLHRIDVFTDKYINKNTELFFNLYMRLLFDGGISEYEDNSEYAPSGCCSLTRKIQKIDTQNTKKSTLCKKSLLILMSRGFF